MLNHISKHSKDVKSITPKIELTIRLFYAGGISLPEACKATGVSYNRAWIVLHSDFGQALVKQIKGELNDEFEALQKKVTKVINDGLDDVKIEIALAAASIWLRAQKEQKFKIEGNIKTDFSDRLAEAISRARQDRSEIQELE